MYIRNVAVLFLLYPVCYTTPNRQHKKIYQYDKMYLHAIICQQVWWLQLLQWHASTAIQFLDAIPIIVPCFFLITWIHFNFLMCYSLFKVSTSTSAVQSTNSAMLHHLRKLKDTPTQCSPLPSPSPSVPEVWSSQRCSCGFKSSGIWCCRWVTSSLWSFQMLASTDPVTQYHIPHNLNPQASSSSHYFLYKELLKRPIRSRCYLSYYWPPDSSLVSLNTSKECDRT